MKWVAFFSMSGSEIANVSLQLGRFPDFLVTNKSTLEGIDLRLLDNIKHNHIVMLPNKPVAEDYAVLLNHIRATALDTLITLHGYLRIVPASVCNSCRIVNGHPGLITVYPELKGKDPQARAVNHSVIGSVLHTVTAGVDEGPIIDVASCDNHYYTIDGVTQQLRQLSQNLWLTYLRKHLQAR